MIKRWIRVKQDTEITRIKSLSNNQRTRKNRRKYKLKKKMIKKNKNSYNFIILYLSVG